VVVRIALRGGGVDCSRLRWVLKEVLVVTLSLRDLHLLLGDVVAEILDARFLNGTCVPTCHLVARELNVKLVDFSLELPIFGLFVVLVRLELVNLSLEFNLLLNVLLNLILHLLLITGGQIQVINGVLDLVKPLLLLVLKLSLFPLVLEPGLLSELLHLVLELLVDS
jgi:hypothetical protein